MMNATIFASITASQLAEGGLLPNRPILDPILCDASTALVYGPGGVGKSWLALGIAWAAASGSSFLGWRAARPHRVHYVDGKTTPAEMRRRLALFGPPPATLDFTLASLEPGRMLDLAEGDSLVRLMEAWGKPELVVLDDLTSLAGVYSTDVDRWHELQRFLTMQRHLRRAMLVVHHANRHGRPRGTSRREAVFDLVLSLRRPRGWQARDGARFEIHVEKAHSLHGAALEPVAAHLQGTEWRWGAAGSSALDRGVGLLRDGLGVEAMGRALGVSRATAFRLQRRARRLGHLTGSCTKEVVR